MSTQTQIAELQDEPDIPRWSLGLRVAFRFCFVYFGLYCLCTQIVGGLISIPKMEAIDPSGLWPIKQVTFWTAAHLFHAKLPLVYTGSGSGDKTFDWVLTFCLLVVAAMATATWSVLDRRSKNYVTLYKWFRLFIRFALASQLVGYGMAKLIPLQMPFPYLTRLIEPFGNFSPMGVLWSSIGASPAYEMFAGSAEMLGGILLIIPRTTMLGALVCVADMTQVGKDAAMGAREHAAQECGGGAAAGQSGPRLRVNGVADRIGDLSATPSWSVSVKAVRVGG